MSVEIQRVEKYGVKVKFALHYKWGEVTIEGFEIVDYRSFLDSLNTEDVLSSFPFGMVKASDEGKLAPRYELMRPSKQQKIKDAVVNLIKHEFEEELEASATFEEENKHE